MLGESMKRLKLKPQISALEQRVLFDAEAVNSAVSALNNADLSQNEVTDEPNHDITPQATADNHKPKEIAFVDAKLDGYDTIVKNIDPNITIYKVDANTDGIEYIADIIKSHDNLDAIHILGHGNSANIILGDANLNSDTIAKYKDELTSIKDSLSSSADILIYGCNVAKDSKGVELVESIAKITDSDVSASDDATGVSGDWELEVASGDIETKAIKIDSYKHNLAVPLYTENDPALDIVDTINVGVGGSYNNGYVEFAIDSTTSGDKLSLTRSATASTANGDVTIVGTAVYKGDGTKAEVIGYIDVVNNGENGKPLRINLSSGFQNGSFDSGAKNNIPGWVINTTPIMLDGVSTIAGHATPVDTTWPAANGAIHDNVTFSTPAADPNVDITTLHQVAGDKAMILDTDDATVHQSYGIMRGPYIYSESTVNLQVGDSVSFDWKALSGGDAYDAYGYLLNVDTGATITILDSTGTSHGQSTPWTTATTNIGAGQAGNYKFVFVAGSYDASGGNALGGQLMIDDIVVNQATPPPDVYKADIEKIAQNLTYENTGNLSAGNALLNKNVTISAVKSGGNTSTASVAFQVQEVNDAPVLNNTNINITDTKEYDTYATFSGNINLTDPDSGTTFDISIAGGTDTGTHYQKVGTHGTLSINKTTGAYTYTVDNDHINSLGTNTTETFSVTASDGALSSTNTVTINITATDDGPRIELRATETIDEDNNISFTTANGNRIVMTDIDSPADTFTVQISATKGVLNLANMTNITTTAGANNSATITVTGLLADIQNMLDSMTYRPNQHYFGADTITINATDGPTAVTNTKTIAITINSVNDTPTTTMTTDISQDVLNTDVYTRDVSGFFSDVEDANLTYSATNLPTGVSINAITGVITGTPTSLGAHNIVVRATDSGGLSGTYSYTLTVLDKPDITLTNSETIDEDHKINFTTANGNRIVITDADSTTTPMQMSLSVTNGVLNLDMTSLTLVSGANGSSSIVVRGLAANLQHTLDNLEYVPTLHYFGGDTLSMGVSDLGNAGANTVLTDSKNIAITINSVNDNPFVVSDPFSSVLIVGENYVQDLSEGFRDIEDTNLTYQIDNLPNGLVLDSATGIVTGRPTAAGFYTIEVRGYDSGMPILHASNTFTIKVISPPKEAPKLHISQPELAKEPINAKTTDVDSRVNLDNMQVNQKYMQTEVVSLVEPKVDSTTDSTEKIDYRVDASKLLITDVAVTIDDSGDVKFDDINKEFYDAVGLKVDAVKVADMFEIKIVDTKSTLRHEVSSLDGSSLPDGIMYDDKKGVISGKSDDVDMLEVSIKAFDNDGKTRVLNVSLDIKKLSNEQFAKDNSNDRLDKQLQTKSDTIKDNKDQKLSSVLSKLYESDNKS
jgi:VCBS repeat-containing protein